MTRLVNNLKTTVLLAAIMGLALAVGSIWGRNGMIVALAIGGATNFFAYFFSDKIALMSMRAQEVSPQQAPELYAIVNELAQRAGIPVPRVYVAPTQAPNAFATGRSPRHAAVCVTQGLLALLSHGEIRAVLAHEIAHVKHYDILTSTVAATIAGAITFLAYLAFFIPVGSRGGRGGGNPLVMLLTLILAPIAATIIQLAISRSREYAADHRGGELSGRPLELAAALVKLEQYGRRMPLRCPRSQQNMFIVQPFSGEEAADLFRTHPATPKRVGRLEDQARAMGGYV